MRVGAALLEHQAAQTLAIVVEQSGRPHRARNQHGIFRQPVARRHIVLAEELVHQPVGEIVEVVQPVAQVRVGDAQHPRARIGLDALDRGLGRQAGPDRFFEAVQPAAVVGEHAVGFEHIAVLAAVGQFAAVEQDFEVRSQRLHRAFEAL